MKLGDGNRYGMLKLMFANPASTLIIIINITLPFTSVRACTQQALLEYDLESFSVFASSPAFSPSGSLTVPSVDPVLYFARRALQQRNGTSTIIKDGAAGDPARYASPPLVSL